MIEDRGSLRETSDDVTEKNPSEAPPVAGSLKKEFSKKKNGVENPKLDR
jgi:hypothetical protein